MRRALLSLVAALAALAALAPALGCGGDLPAPRIVQHGADEVGQAVPTPPPPGKVEIIPQRPPELKHPIWLDGEWTWDGRRWVWKDHGWQENPTDEGYAPPLTRRLPPPDGRLVHLPGVWRKKDAPSP